MILIISCFGVQFCAVLHPMYVFIYLVTPFLEWEFISDCAISLFTLPFSACGSSGSPVFAPPIDMRVSNELKIS